MRTARCAGVESTWGTVGPEGWYLAGSSWSRKGDDAIRFLSRGDAGARCHAAPAGALLRPDGTPDRPLPVCRVAVECEPPRLARHAENSRLQSLLGQLDLDGGSDPRHDGAPPHRRGTVPSRQAGRNSRAPPCNLRAARLKSVIYQYSPWRPLPRSWDDWRAAAARPPDAGAESVIRRASPVAIGWRQVTVTECNQQTVTDWSQFALPADSGQLAMLWLSLPYGRISATYARCVLVRSASGRDPWLPPSPQHAT